ncbi:putative ABC transporter A family member 2-like [Capsicum annuum]|nr:putative ABC transporter A family member 2-like [Capsicum annuum]
MDHSWRPHLHPPAPAPAPPIQSTICPSCSISHFPFCPPPHQPPPFPSNPTFQYPHQPFPHPYPHDSGVYDPFIDHRGGPPHIPPPPPPPYGNLNPSYDSPPPAGPFNVGVKRMRVDDSPAPLPRFSADNQRRLELINEFGAPDYDGFIGGRNSNTGGYLDHQGYGNLDRNQTFLDQQLYERQQYSLREGNVNEERFERQQYPTREGNVQFGQLRYDELDNNFSRRNGYKYGGGGHQADSYHNVEREFPWDRVSGMKKLYHEQPSCLPMDGRGYNHHYSEGYAMQNHVESKSNHYGSPYDHKVNSLDRCGMSLYSEQGSKGFASQPPLPASPPPPLPMEPPLCERLVSSSPPGASASLFPVPVGSSAPLSSYYPPPPEEKSISRYKQPNLHVSSRSAAEEVPVHRYTSSSIHSRGSEHPLLEVPSVKSKVIDASHILKHPYRATRPDHLVVILRGLPGSGKSYLAKMLRDLEVENGGSAPRIHSMDDYFMTEVDKVEESEISKSSGSIRGKKMVTKKVMEYCYEPEMEEAYRSSMLKAFKKTLDEGAFSFVIVDDRNLRVADFAQFWATAKRSGYEVYLLEATYKDPAGCAARNVHGFTRDDVQKMAGRWEEAPSMYLKLDVKSLLHGDALEEGGIQEVDMDMEDDDSLGVPSTLDEENIEDTPVYGDVKDDQDSDHEEEHRTTEVKELAKSKWSSDLDEDDTQTNKDATKNLNALSGLIQSYSKERKSVRWGDQVTKRGFSIGAAKTTSVSLIIGPGAGYNLKSNPLPDEEKFTSARNNGEPKRQNIFQERLRAEHESFRAVFESFRTGFDKRRQRIVGLNAEDE